MPLSSQADPLLTIDGPTGTFVFQYFEIPEFVHFGGPFQTVVHRQPGGIRQIDSMGANPNPITWSGIMLTADGWFRARTLYAMYEAGDKVVATWRDWEKTCIISDLKINYRAVNYVEYTIELTEVITAVAGDIVAGAGVPTVAQLNTALQNAIGVFQPLTNFATTLIGAF